MTASTAVSYSSEITCFSSILSARGLASGFSNSVARLYFAFSSWTTFLVFCSLFFAAIVNSPVRSLMVSDSAGNFSAGVVTLVLLVILLVSGVIGQRTGWTVCYTVGNWFY